MSPFDDDSDAMRRIVKAAIIAISLACVIRMLPTIVYLARYGIPE